jgi:hypothetical protein
LVRQTHRKSDLFLRRSKNGVDYSGISWYDLIMKATNKLLKDFKEYNQLMKRVGSKPKTLEEYVTYRSGKMGRTYRKKPLKSPMEASTYRRESPKIPSGDTYDTFAAPKREMKYTGDKLLGIATMHKSNAVPVFRKEDAEDIARMRR